MDTDRVLYHQTQGANIIPILTYGLMPFSECRKKGIRIISGGYHDMVHPGYPEVVSFNESSNFIRDGDYPPMVVNDFVIVDGDIIHKTIKIHGHRAYGSIIPPEHILAVCVVDKERSMDEARNLADQQQRLPPNFWTPVYYKDGDKRASLFLPDFLTILE